MADGPRRACGEMEARANQLAHHFATQEIERRPRRDLRLQLDHDGPGRVRAPGPSRYNINYRYVKDGLGYLLTNANLQALVYQRGLTPLVGAAELPHLHRD